MWKTVLAFSASGFLIALGWIVFVLRTFTNDEQPVNQVLRALAFVSCPFLFVSLRNLFIVPFLNAGLYGAIGFLFKKALRR